MKVFRRHTLRVIFSHFNKVLLYCLQIKTTNHETSAEFGTSYHITLTAPYLSMVETVRVACGSAKKFNNHKHPDNPIRQNPDLCDLI